MLVQQVSQLTSYMSANMCFCSRDMNYIHVDDVALSDFL